MIRNRLKKHGIQSLLRKRVRGLKKNVAGTPEIVDAFVSRIENGKELKDCFSEHMSLTTYLLITSALDGKNQGQGRGFPFDQPYLIFYQRLVRLQNVLQKHFGARPKGKRLYDKIYHELIPVLKDSILRKAAAKMEEKVNVFNQLREAMRITLPENKLGLNEPGDTLNMKTIEKAVEKFRKQFCKNKVYEKDEGYQKMTRQIDKYWGMLFTDPIIVETKTGKIAIQPQRTNNISEQHFRRLTRSYCKKNGFMPWKKQSEQ